MTALSNEDQALVNIMDQMVSDLTTWKATVTGPSYDYTAMQPMLDAAARNFQAFVDSYRQAKELKSAGG